MKIQAWLCLTIASSVSANTDYEPWWGDSQREIEWVLGQGYLAGDQMAPYPCLIIPTQAIETRQKQLTFRLTYLENDIHDTKFIKRARLAVGSTMNKPNKPYYTLVLTITIEKEKRLHGPLLQLTAPSQRWLDAGDMQQFYRQCGTHYIQSAIVESSMRLWISYHPQIAEQAKKLQQLLSTNFPDKSAQDVTRLSWFKTLEQANIGPIPTRLYMEGWGNGPITPPFPDSGQPVDHTLIEDWINQALLRIYQPQGGQIKKVHRLPWLSTYPAVATYCIHHPSKCELKTFYLLNEAWETKTQWRRRYRLLALMQTHHDTSLHDCFRLFSLLDTQNQTALWLQCQKEAYQGELQKTCQTLAKAMDYCDQSRVCYNCTKLLELSTAPCQRYPDLLAFEPTQKMEKGKIPSPILLGQSWNAHKRNTVCLTTDKRDLPEQTVQTILLHYPIAQSSAGMSYQTHIDYRQRVGLDPNHWSPDIERLGKGRAFFRACGSHYASEIRFSQQIAFQTHYNANQPDKSQYEIEYKQLKTNCDAPSSKMTPNTFTCPIEVTFRPWRLELYKELTNPAIPIEDCSPKLSPQECWQSIKKE